MKTELHDRWIIQDEEGVIHEGPEHEMDVAWDYMTMTLDELYKMHHGEISKEDLQEGITKYKDEWKGDLELICIKKVHR